MIYSKHVLGHRVVAINRRRVRLRRSTGRMTMALESIVLDNGVTLVPIVAESDYGFYVTTLHEVQQKRNA